MARRRRPSPAEDVEIPDGIWLDVLTGEPADYDRTREWLAEHGLELAMFWALGQHNLECAAGYDGPVRCPCPAHCDVRGVRAVVEHVERLAGWRRR